MTDRQMRWERIGNFLAVIVAVMLASVIVALAQAPEPVVLTPPPAVAKVELKKPRVQHLPVPPAVISQLGDASDALKKLAAGQRCLAEVMYFEARSEGEVGERAIAEVILHRLAQGAHGHSICGVVYEGASQTFCQFTFVCDGSLDRPRLPDAWRAAQVLAARILAGEGTGTDSTDGATSFHTVTAHPSWAPKMERVVRIGNHVFYRARAAAISVTFRGPLE